MSGWSAAELGAVGRSDELQIASRRDDGSLRPYVTIWTVRVGDELFVRSAYGATNPWFVRAKRAQYGRIRAGGVERDVAFAPADDADAATIDTEYHRKYDRYGQRIVETVVGEMAHPNTLRLTPEE
ncbi:DUF2255 family protein [Humibacter antri]